MDTRYFEEAKRLIDAGYVTGIDMHTLADKLAKTQAKRMKNRPEKLPEQEDGKPVTIVDSRKSFISKT